MTDNSLQSALLWVQSLLLGQIGTTIAVLAVAVTGFNMLRGYMSTKDGARVIIGCFVLFGAPAIAHGLFGVVPRSAPAEIIPQPQYAKGSTLAVPAQHSSINPFDPYAGTAPRN